MKIIFYLLGEKGYTALLHFLSEFGGKTIERVIAAQDQGVQNDFFKEIKTLCASNSIQFFEKSEQKDAPTDCHAFAIGWRWIIPHSDNLIVFHDSLLPKYRGFSPLVNMLINGERKIGVTALYATNEYDKGDIVWQSELKINYPIKIQEAINLISPLYAKAVVEIFGMLINKKTIQRVKQVEEYATYSLWRDEEDYIINWNHCSEKIKRICDAVGYPFKGAVSFIKGKKIKILEVEQYPDVYIEARDDHVGKIIFMENNKPVVICKKGLIKIDSYKYENKEPAMKPLSFRSKFTS